LNAEVSAYTTTKLGALGVEEKKVANPELFFWQRVTCNHIWRISPLILAKAKDTGEYNCNNGTKTETELLGFTGG
jgi:hypothetical protein